ncbi:MAG TPA: PaaI family thioesterase [Gallionellaceae bacterium]|nr:PaaI family thioesterase [Gallionellaceae bacterium]
MTQQAEKKWVTAADLNAVSRHTIMEALDIRVEEFSEDHIILSMPISDATRQPYGLLHGGVSMVLAETAASFHACWGIDIMDKAPVGIEINGSHLNSADSGNVRAVGKVLRKSASLIVHEIEITHVETGRLLCVSRVTNFYKKLRHKPGTN